MVEQFRKILRGAGGIERLVQVLGREQLITASGLETALRQIGIRMKQQDVAMLFRAIDQEGTGRVSTEEFVQTVGGR